MSGPGGCLQSWHLYLAVERGQARLLIGCTPEIRRRIKEIAAAIQLDRTLSVRYGGTLEHLLLLQQELRAELSGLELHQALPDTASRLYRGDAILAARRFVTARAPHYELMLCGPLPLPSSILA